MADINQVISLGIGTPADIKHFILVGLSPNVVVVNATAIGIGTEVLAESGTAVAVGTGGAGSPWVGYEPRDLYAPRLVKKLKPVVVPVLVAERVDAVAVGIGVETYVRAGKARSRGTHVVHARAQGIGVEALAVVGRVTAAGSASARGRFPGDDDDEVLAWILSVAA